MIKLNRGQQPHVLATNAESWKAEYLRLVAGDDSVPRAARTRYAHPEIKASVLRDSHGKCMYCESKPMAVYPGAVEHILPKAPHRFPEKVVDWDNLGFVCFKCNQVKGDYWSEDVPILDPYEDEPSDYLQFFGPLVLSLRDEPRGVITVHKLQLDRRPDLIDRKAEHIRKLKTYLQAWRAREGPLKTVLEEQIRELASDGAEYAATSRTLLRLEDFPI